MDTKPPRKIDLFDPTHNADPYPTYAKLRLEVPVYQTKSQDGRTLWVVTRYQDVQTVLKDARFVKDIRSASTPEQNAALNARLQALAFRVLSQNMLSADPPSHTRLRGLISKAFTPRRTEQLRPRIEQLTDELLDAMEGKTELDLINDFAFPLPIRVISEMLGIPEADRDNFRLWSNMLIDGSGPDSPETNRQKSASNFLQYLTQLVAERRVRPSNNSSSSDDKDLITALIEAEEQGDKLDEEQLIAMIWLLIIAGHETTVNLIGNGMLALFQHPDQLEMLKNNPELIKPAIEELLRYNGPVETSTSRFAGEDLVLDGQPISKGDAVLAVIAGADRDPEQFADPNNLDITRANNPHVAFGYGIHYCIGAPLARLEGQIAFRKLLERKPTIHLAVPVQELRWRPNLILRGLQTLPVAF